MFCQGRSERLVRGIRVTAEGVGPSTDRQAERTRILDKRRWLPCWQRVELVETCSQEAMTRREAAAWARVSPDAYRRLGRDPQHLADLERGNTWRSGSCVILADTRLPSSSGGLSWGRHAKPFSFACRPQ